MQHLKDRFSQKDLTDGTDNFLSTHVPMAAKDQNRTQAVSVQLFHVLQLEKGITDNHIFIGLDQNNAVCIELGFLDNNGDEQTEICIYRGADIYIGEINSAKALSKYTNKNNDYIKLLALLQKNRDAEFVSFYQKINSYLVMPQTEDFWTTVDEKDTFVKTMCLLSQNIYYLEKEGTININTKKLNQKELGNSHILRAILGKPKFFQMVDNATKSGGAADVLKKYALREDIPEEMIPKMPDWYITPNWVLTTAQDIQESALFPQKYRNVLLKGPSGTGKTKGSQAMASCLGLPYCKVTCSPDSEIFEFIGQMLPNTNKYCNGETTQEIFDKLDIPSFEDVENDFEGTYQKLFGNKPGRLASAADCYSEIMRKTLTAEGKDESDFVYVESDFIKAIRNGWFCEIQEPTVLKRSSVLVGLNALLENDSDTNFYTLPTGEILRRHPDSVIVLTTNSDYEGCNNIQQSVLSRIDIVREIGNPTAMKLSERTISQTGFPDKGCMLVMSEMILAINEYCEKNDITDGICGPRELSNWAKKAMLLAKREESKVEDYVLDAAFSTLIPKISQTKDDAEDVITACLQTKWSQDDVEGAKLKYEEGLV